MDDQTPPDHDRPPEPAQDTQPAPETPGPEPRSAAPKVAIVLGVVLALAVGTAVFVLRSDTTSAALDERVPATAVAFGQVSLRPAGDQRAALNAILDRLPAAQRDRFGDTLDDGLDSMFSELGLSWRDDIKPWVGNEIGFVVPTIGAVTLVTGPEAIGMLSVRNEGRAREALRRAVDASGSGAFEVRDGIAYLGESASGLTAFIDAAADAPPLSEDDAYRAARQRLGDGLAFLWFDGRQLSPLFGIAGVGPAAGEIGSFAMVARATPDSIVVEGRAFGGEAPQTDGGAPRLLERTSSGLLGALSVFDPGAALVGVTEALAQFPFGVAEFLEPFEVLGLDLERDLAPWLHGEVSLIFGGFAGFLPDIGLLVESTDDDALDRTIEALRTRAGALGDFLGIDLEAASVAGGLSIGSEGVGAFFQRRPGRLVIASSPNYAQELLEGSADVLADDVVYRRAVGDTRDGIGFQMFVRVDRIRDLILAFMPSPEDRAEYETTVGPVVDLIEAVGIKATNEDGGSFTMTITLTR